MISLLCRGITAIMVQMFTYAGSWDPDRIDI